jgi:D-galacturonate reductase
MGTGEYTTGFVAGKKSASDKSIGVVALTMFDLRRRGKVGNLGMCGVDGDSFDDLREHFDQNISKVYNNLDVAFNQFPAKGVQSVVAYKTAIDSLHRGDAITIFTPDDVHYDIAKYAVEHGIHVLIAKPAVQKIEDHMDLIESGRRNNVFVYIEHHKRYDPTYSDARIKAQTLGDFNYFYSYMAQPKSQLATFKAWAGKASDISYYLNSHHVDVCDSMVRPLGWKPVKVAAMAAKGIATSLGYPAEDTITITAMWKKKDDPEKVATGVYTSSWTAPQTGGVHT